MNIPVEIVLEPCTGNTCVREKILSLLISVLKHIDMFQKQTRGFLANREIKA